MAGAATIGSHGRIHRTSARSVGSFGRLLRPYDEGVFFYGFIRTIRGNFSVCLDAKAHIDTAVLSLSHISPDVVGFDHIAVQVIPKAHIVPIVTARDDREE